MMKFRMDTQTLNPDRTQGLVLSTESFSLYEKREWLREVIGRQYANVEITPPKTGNLFNEMTIYPWQNLQLSVIRSNAITIERLPKDENLVSQDAYFAIILLSGQYMLEQNGREVFLKPGEMTLYDATRPHRIYCPDSFSKLLISIPRAALRDRVAGIEHCTALPIQNDEGIRAVAANFIRTTVSNINQLSMCEFFAMSELSLDLLTLALTSVRPDNFSLSRSRSLSLYRVKDFVERHLTDSHMDTTKVATGTKLSPRYINSLFQDDETSLMRYIWRRRLEHCRKDMLNPAHLGHRITDIALHWGFNDLAHFSRSFKRQYGGSPREYRQYHSAMT